MENSISIYNRKRVPVPGTVIKQFHTQRFFILTVSHYSALFIAAEHGFGNYQMMFRGRGQMIIIIKKCSPTVVTFCWAAFSIFYCTYFFY